MLVASVAVAQTSVGVVMKDGTRTALELADGLTLRVDGGMLRADAPGAPAFAIEDVQRLEYGDAAAVADAVAPAGTSIFFNGRVLRINSGDSGTLRVADAAGRTVLSQGFCGSVQVDMSGWAPGVYVVRAGDAPAVKIAVR